MMNTRFVLCVMFAAAAGAVAQAQTAAPASLAALLTKLGAVSDGRSELDRAAARGDGALVPAGLVASAPMVLLGAKALPVQDANELIAWMKSNGRSVRIAHGGAWSASLECALQLQELLGTKLSLIASADSAKALETIKSGAADVFCDAVPTIMADVQSGDVIAHVLATDERLQSLWDVATADQAGLPLFSATAWLGLYARPTEVSVAATALQKAITDETLIQTLAELGWTPFPPALQTPSAHRQQLESEAERRRERLTADGLPQSP